ncbi:MAG TPA: tetratricopeptide repeat protein [Dongiaceae bacterium]|nr:tetratricopeptide repeat protein [Dongiaceae bacterium]
MGPAPHRRPRRAASHAWTLALLLLAARAGEAFADTATGLEEMKRHNYIRAIIELEDPARAGDPVAQASLGAIYHYGLGIAADFTAARKWYRAAALQNNVDGQLGLAVLYALGQGVPQDLAVAHMWLAAAADAMPPTRDRARVAEDRDALAARMSPAELRRSEALLDAWYRRHEAP